MNELGKLIEEVCNDMCDNYCKYQANCKDDELDEHCGDCPMCRIN